MPSSVVIAIFNAADTLLNSTLFGETVTYTFYETGISKEIIIRIDRGVNLGKDKSSKVVQDLGAQNAVSYQAVGYVFVSDIANPVYLDSIVAIGPGGNAETWMVMLIVESDNSCHTVALRNDLRPQL